jgi:hypothetical protein
VKSSGRALSDRELRDLLVTELELVMPEDFDKASGGPGVCRSRSEGRRRSR